MSKVIIPESPTGRKDHRYLFVDFPTPEMAQRAVKARNEAWAWGVEVSVRMALPFDSRKVGEREAWEEEYGDAGDWRAAMYDFGA